MKKAKIGQFTAVFTRDLEDGGWVAQCAEVPSAITQGETLAEAKRNLLKAIRFMLQVEANEVLSSAPKGAKIQEVKVAL